MCTFVFVSLVASGRGRGLLRASTGPAGSGERNMLLTAPPDERWHVWSDRAHELARERAPVHHVGRRGSGRVGVLGLWFGAGLWRSRNDDWRGKHCARQHAFLSGTLGKRATNPWFLYRRVQKRGCSSKYVSPEAKYTGGARSTKNAICAWTPIPRAVN